MQGNRLLQGQIGITVRSAEGTRLGTVTRCDAERFIIGAGEFFDEPYEAGYDEILAYKNGEIYLNRHNEQLIHERRHIPAVGAAVPYALEEERELAIAMEISTDQPHRASKNDAA